MLRTMAGQQKLEQILICQHLSREPKHSGTATTGEEDFVDSHFTLPSQLGHCDGKGITHSTRQGAQCPSPGGCQGLQEAVPGRGRVREFPSTPDWRGIKAPAASTGAQQLHWYEKGFWSSHTYNPSPCSSLPFTTTKHLLEGI